MKSCDPCPPDYVAAPLPSRSDSCSPVRKADVDLIESQVAGKRHQRPTSTQSRQSKRLRKSKPRADVSTDGDDDTEAHEEADSTEHFSDTAGKKTKPTTANTTAPNSSPTPEQLHIAALEKLAQSTAEAEKLRVAEMQRHIDFLTKQLAANAA